MLLSDFWARQRFGYIITYSFQRSPELTVLKKQLRQELEAGRSMRWFGIYEKLERLEQYSVTLTEGLGAIHPTATAVARLASESAGVHQLDTMLQHVTEQECYTMCPPVYRDALAFYSEADELVSMLNICFQCRFMQTNQLEHVEADMATYDSLQAFLTQLGHPIVEDE